MLGYLSLDIICSSKLKVLKLKLKMCKYDLINLRNILPQDTLSAQVWPEYDSCWRPIYEHLAVGYFDFQSEAMEFFFWHPSASAQTRTMNTAHQQSTKISLTLLLMALQLHADLSVSFGNEGHHWIYQLQGSVLFLWAFITHTEQVWLRS